jgi:co-chaperonin GroES (HSP10)
MDNSSGFWPSGDRILIKVDEIEQKGSIVIPDTAASKRMDAQVLGVLIATGPDAYIHYVKESSDGSVEVSKYTQPYAKVGQRVMFAKFGGIDFLGEDGKSYRVMRDEDITGVVSDTLTLADIEVRTPLAKKK